MNPVHPYIGSLESRLYKDDAFLTCPGREKDLPPVSTLLLREPV